MIRYGHLHCNFWDDYAGIFIWNWKRWYHARDVARAFGVSYYLTNSEEVGYYDPIAKNYKFDSEKIQKWLRNGVQPTETVANLLKKANII